MLRDKNWGVDVKYDVRMGMFGIYRLLDDIQLDLWLM